MADIFVKICLPVNYASLYTVRVVPKREKDIHIMFTSMTRNVSFQKCAEISELAFKSQLIHLTERGGSNQWTSSTTTRI